MLITEEELTWIRKKAKKKIQSKEGQEKIQEIRRRIKRRYPSMTELFMLLGSLLTKRDRHE